MHNFLKQYYFINKFNPDHLTNLSKNIGIIYRNYSKNNNILTINKINKFCKSNGRKFYLSNNIKLAIKLNLDGAYIPSFNNSYKHLSYNFKKDFSLLGSAHNIREIRNKEIQKVEYIFLSSLFKKNTNYLGINKFNNISKFTKKKIVALGGISRENLKKLKLVHCSGFSGISYFE